MKEATIRRSVSFYPNAEVAIPPHLTGLDCDLQDQQRGFRSSSNPATTARCLVRADGMTPEWAITCAGTIRLVQLPANDKASE